MSDSHKAMRDDKGRFLEGNSGKPRGARHQTTIAVQSLLEGEAEGLTRKAIEKALEGDSVALRLCLERIAPPPRDRSVRFPLADDLSHHQPSRAGFDVIQAMSRGELSPSEAAVVMAIIKQHFEMTSLEAIERRLEALERASEGGR